MDTLRSLKSNNKGVSLIELIVVILIIGILATMLVVNAASVQGRNAADAARKLSDLLDEVRLETMNRENGRMYVKVYMDASTRDIKAQVFYQKEAGEVEGDVIELGNSALSLTFNLENENGAVTDSTTVLSPTNPIYLQFSKSTGAFTKCSKNDPSNIDKQFGSITFKGIRTATLVLVWDTGRSYLAND